MLPLDGLLVIAPDRVVLGPVYTIFQAGGKAEKHFGGAVKCSEFAA